jgi:hypothetical protein
MLNEISQTEKDKCHMFSYAQSRPKEIMPGKNDMSVNRTVWGGEPGGRRSDERRGCWGGAFRM